MRDEKEKVRNFAQVSLLSDGEGKERRKRDEIFPFLNDP